MENILDLERKKMESLSKEELNKIINYYNSMLDDSYYEPPKNVELIYYKLLDNILIL